METILFFAFLWQTANPDFFVYQKSTPENIEYCTNISFDPSMSEEFEKNCNREQVNAYIMSVKEN